MASYDGLSPVFSAQLQALINASGGKLYLESGYRSVEEQQRLWDAAVQKYGSADAARKWVAPPGHSNHNKGAAGDLGGDLELAHQLAPQFGLVFPMDYEPWHVELSSQRDHASQDAYSQAPAGSSYPKEADWSLSPDKLAGSLAESLLGAGIGLSSSAMTNVSTTAAAASEGSTQGGGGSAVTGGNVSPTALYQALKAAGMPAVAAAQFVAIAGRESGFNTGAYNGNRSTGDDSYGLFQINLLNGGWTDFLKAHGLSDPASQLKTLDGSVKAAAAIYGSSGLQPWGGYKGMPWSYGTDPNVGVQASGGEVSLDELGVG